MSIDVRVPPLGDSTSGAKVSAWLKQEGDSVTAGEVIAEIETDKTIVEVVAPSTGQLLTILVPAGGPELDEAGVLAVIVEQQTVGGSSEPPPAVAAAASVPVVVQTTSQSTPTAARVPDAESALPSRREKITVAATPLAERMAMVLDIDLGLVAGTGDAGKVTKADLDRFVSASTVAPPPPPAFEDRPLSAMRRVSAARLLQAKQTIPHFYLSTECATDALVAARSRLNGAEPAAAITLTDFVIRAVALALHAVPEANGTWHDGVVRVFERVDVAVAVNTSRGLITPIVWDAGNKTLDQISREFRALTSRARSGELTPPEYTGGTVTISNLGMFGVGSLYAILNPPQSCLFGIGALEQRPIVRDGRVAVGSMMTCTLSADHRVIDGATGATLLQEFRRAIENPSLIGA